MAETAFEFGIGFQSDKAPHEYAGLARLAESVGFDVLIVYNDLYYQPALPALLLMAQATSRVRLGPVCLNPFTLHPIEIAGQIALLDMVSEGRAFLGLARGAWLESLGITPQRPVAALAEAAEVVAHLLDGRRDAYSGTVFQLPPNMPLRYTPQRSSVPLLIGTWGKQTAAIAGRLANEVKLGGSANPAMVAVMRAYLAVGEAAAERAAGSVGVVLGAVTVVDRDRVAARRRARQEVALYLDVVANLDPTYQPDPDEIAAVRKAVAEGDTGAAGNAISDATLDRFAFAGTPADIIRQVEAIIAAGAKRVEFGTPHGLSETDGITLLGREVLPYFKR